MNIGPYAVISEIGRGGMGVVYKAQNPTDSRTVAIKMISGIQALDETHRMGLVREARTAGNLRHPNIVRVYDIGQHKGWLYLVMEYLEGVPLDRCIKAENSLPICDKVSILIQLCSGLAYAHSFGIVHRDIKPANVFVLADQTIKILDFGLAIGRDHNNSNHFAGTVPYMSPEQFQRAELDCRSDIWSAGITMYELLAGEVPFKGKGVTEIREQVLFAPIPPLGEFVSHRTEFQGILARALAKNLNDRYPSAKLRSTDLQTLDSQLQGEVADSGSQVATQPHSSPVQTNSSLQTTVTAYGGVDLNLRTDYASAILVRQGKLYLIGISRKLQDLRILTFYIALLSIFLLPQIPEAWQTTYLLSLFIGISLFGAGIPVRALLEAIDILSHYPRCRSCSLPMSSASRWTRFVLTNSEVTLGYRDCIAALKENLWEDAAKLLCVHGSEPTFLFGSKVISTPLRYHLEFYECRSCGQQAARLTTDDLIEDQWQLRTELTDAYRGGSKRQVQLARTLRGAPRRFFDVWVTVLRDACPGRLDMRVVAGIAVYAVLLSSVFLYGRHTEKHNREVETRQAQLDVQATKARQMGQSYFYGYGVRRDPQIAAQYFVEASRAGDGYSANQLGLMYENAIGVPQSYKNAAAWYGLAARRGDLDGIMNFGRVCENGIGTPKDLEQARYWYGLAASVGYKDAKSRLYRLPAK